MATLITFANVLSGNYSGENLHVPKRLLFVAPVCMRMACRSQKLTGAICYRQRNLCHLRKIREMCLGGDVVRPAYSVSDGLRRAGSPSSSDLLHTNDDRRRILVSSLFLLSSVPFLELTLFQAAFQAAADAEDETTEVPLVIYSDTKDGFALLRPAPWTKVDKSGACIFFEDPQSRSNNIGVTVTPVRIPSLDGFGSVDDIVKKLVKAERDKPSTKDMQVIRVFERKLRDNTTLYSLEYTLDTTRGCKRVLTSVTVAGYKLYILSIVFIDGPVAPASSVLNDVLHQVLNSFELLV